MTVVEQKEKKDYTFQNNIMDLRVECLENGVVPSPEVCNSVLKIIIMLLLKINFSIRLMTQWSRRGNTVLSRLLELMSKGHILIKCLGGACAELRNKDEEI